MSVFSSGSKWKNAAREALKSAQAIESTQRDIEAQRSLLANIRQHRLASAQLDLMNYSDSYTSSSDAEALTIKVAFTVIVLTSSFCPLYVFAGIRYSV